MLRKSRPAFEILAPQFLEEMKSLQNLAHPRIVEINDYGYSDYIRILPGKKRINEEAIFAILELCGNGEILAEVCKYGELSEDIGRFYFT